MSEIKAIETRYKGCRFRSRLEARWAVFFDALGVKWEYEKEGFDLGEAGYYLPDFWLPDHGYIEVKGNPNEFTEDEDRKCLAFGESQPLLIFWGQVEMPKVEWLRLAWPVPEELRPTSNEGDEWNTFMEAGLVSHIRMTCGPYGMERNGYINHGDDLWSFTIGYRITSGSVARSLAPCRSLPSDDAKEKYPHPDHPCHIDHRPWCWQERKDGSFLPWPIGAWEWGPDCEREEPSGRIIGCPLVAGEKFVDSKRLGEAYRKARSARFEHGESP
jgi:hypothetical protein